ncbi:ribonuclease M5 [Tuanshanicoccus lijuaniae]|uniref:ribonuclease M5 n=1 Tax=Aerococcaceae bacterium zg-1292 TaxID=2774330 RepID=UPI001937FEA5|nr:ribonuclease M5 [Aerococcaceae bacterium zg-1292]MBS4456790.1 ribonuclease M5 [Aerococcaceae bacterium zg-A91]MBS4458582.1 ribonuclease M5 [Aerococcaceae bacterium zg-BR33]QQA36689.1 ribonuclease M5 [Aerococcaceae bacterium zg-1292]
MNKPPQEVIIVEGRDDTKRLIETFGPYVKTIETNGSAVSRSVQQQIVAASEQFGIIIFTDPDYQGERIRRIVTALVPQAKQAYLTQQEADSGKEHKSLGIEHALPETILKALAHVMTPEVGPVDTIELSDLIRLRLIGHPQAVKRRSWLSEQLRIGHLNGKQLQKKLSVYHISLEQVEAVLAQLEE